MKQTSLILLVFLCSALTLKAQVKTQEIGTSINVPKAKAGTYQFIYHSSKIKYFFTTETLKEIERNRDRKVIKFIWLNPDVQVKILPKEYIESVDFIPLPEIIYAD